MLHILLVEDEALTAMMLKEALELEGMHVLVTGLGTEAVSLILREKISLVLLDLRLPDIDGLDILRSLRRNDIAVPPTIVFSGAGDSSGEEARKLGVIEFVNKPADVKYLAQRIRAVASQASQTVRPFSRRCGA